MRDWPRRCVTEGASWPTLPRMPAPLVTVDPSFPEHLRTRTPLELGHALVDEPMLSLESIASLAAELGPESISFERAQKGLVADTADVEFAPADVAAQILELAAGDSWFTLLNIEHVDGYRRLVDRILESLAGASGLPPEVMRRRMGFVFASSPRSVTSAHFDIEQSVMFQLAGERTLGFGRFSDAAHRQHEIDRYWSGSFGRLEAMPEHVSEVAVGPGVGCYIPPYTPHWLTNGDSLSLSLTLTFFERSNEDESMAQAFNARLGRRGVPTRPYGERPTVDRLKVGGMRGYRSLKRLVRRGPERSASH